MEPHDSSKRSDTQPDGTRLLERIETLEAMLSREREISADLKEDRDRWRNQATGLLVDLRSAQEKISETNSKTEANYTQEGNFKPIPPRPWLWRIIGKKS